MAINPYKVVEKNIDVMTLVDKSSLSKSGYKTMEEVPEDVINKLYYPKGRYQGDLTINGTLLVNNGYFGGVTYEPKEYERLDIDINGNKLQSVPTPSRKGISKGQLVLISAFAISVLTYKYSKGNKEFKAFLGLLSPFILFYGITRYNIYKKRKETQEYQSRGDGFNNA